MSKLDKNGLPFAVGLYEYQGYSHDWRGAKLQVNSCTENTSSTVYAHTVIVESTGNMGFYNKIGSKAKIRFCDLVRLSDQDYIVPKEVIVDDVFNFNFK